MSLDDTDLDDTSLAGGDLYGIGFYRIGFHRIAVTAIDGSSHSLAEYRGKTLLIVNVASHCGYTPQYEGPLLSSPKSTSMAHRRTHSTCG